MKEHDLKNILELVKNGRLRPSLALKLLERNDITGCGEMNSRTCNSHIFR